MPKYEKYPNESQEEANIRISKNIENTGLPSIDARDRLQTSPDTTSYKEGGKVKSTYSASKTWKDVRKAAKKLVIQILMENQQPKKLKSLKKERRRNNARNRSK